MKNYYVYMMTNKYNNVLYAGVTGNLVKRIYQHKHKVHLGFTNKYNINKLVYYEVYEDPKYGDKERKDNQKLIEE